MKKRTTAKKIMRFLTAALALALLLATSLSANAPVIETSAAYIRELSNVKLNTSDYFSSSATTKLPSTVNSNEEISVIIKTTVPSLLDEYEKTDRSLTFAEFAATDRANEIRAAIELECKEIEKQLTDSKIRYEKTGITYDTLLTGFEITLIAGEFDCAVSAIGNRAMTIVSEAYEKAETQLVENKVNFYEGTGIFDSSDFKYDGSGMVIAVLDTGLDYTHSAFSPDRFTSTELGLTKDEINLIINKTVASQLVGGLVADDVYINDKVPFAFDYADCDPDVYSLHSNHGTHVSGIIVGNDDVITGVAPNAQLVSMKIFSDKRDSALTSWIFNALEDCVLLGVDVINMSLGSACGYSRATDKIVTSDVYERLESIGTSVVVAASNSFSSAYNSKKNGNLPLTSNPDSATVGSPGSYEASLAVASISGKKTPYMLFNNQIIYFNEASDAASEERDFFGELLTDGSTSAELEYILIPGAGRNADYTGIDVAGKVVLVKRGSNTFEEKANIAQKKGAKAIIIYNNVAGDIRMSVGMSNIPVCSISQDDGEMLAAQKKGTIVINTAQTSGPFMSEFSSWGPGPDLSIKPEITAHGGNILSAVTGGSYDEVSGTSMACPNMAGVVALLRQYVMNDLRFLVTVEGAVDNTLVNTVVYRLLMSTADIVINKNGLPYAVRKQGAGLANLTDAALTTAYILTYSKDDGSIMDRSKIELGDDPNKTGVYNLKFAIDNFGSTSLTYDITASVLTEGVSETKTHDGETTVTEQAHALSGATVVVSSVRNGTQNGSAVTVAAGKTAEVVVTITLSDADKKYLDESFENGMYVEGFVMLDAKSGTDVDLNVPYLAFYGDWTKSPIFDLEYYDTNRDELDSSIQDLDKTLADAFATRPIGEVEGDFLAYLGGYYFIQNPKDKIIAADKDFIAISNVEGSVHSIKYIWAGLLRNTREVDITITDAATGEVVFHTVDNYVRKSYGDGGDIRPTSIEVSFDAAEHNLKNNTEYIVRCVATVDYGDGGLETNEKNVFEFPFMTDFQAPTLTDCSFYTEYDKDLKKTRLFVKASIYDNHYAMCMSPGYISEILDENGDLAYNLTNFGNYLTPIYASKDLTTEVIYEITDHIYEIKENSINKNTFILAVYDFALNVSTYEIPLPDEYVDFYLEESEITLSPYQTYTLTPLIYPDTEWPELLTYKSSDEDVVRIVNNKIVAVASGSARIYIYDEDNPDKETVLDVTVLKEGDEGYKKYDMPVADVFSLSGYEVLKAYYRVSSEDRDIGQKGETRSFDGNYSLTMFPSESVKLKIDLAAYFPDLVDIVFEANDETIATIDENGVIVANEKGYSSVSVRVLLGGKSTYYSATVNIEVKDPYIRQGAWLMNYYGNGGIVTIPESLRFTEIYQFAFSNYEYILKDESEITLEEPDKSKIWYRGESEITKIIIPEGVEKIGSYAFAGIESLTEVVLPSTLKSIDFGAFYGCKNLKKVTGIENVQLINIEAFYGCSIEGTLNLAGVHAVGDYAFYSNQSIEELIIPDTIRSIGAFAFTDNISLETVTINADKLKLGNYVFAGCKNLEEITVNAPVIPTGAFYNCSSLKYVTIGKDVASISEFAFAKTKVESFAISEGNTTYMPTEGKNYILSASGNVLVLASPAISGTFTLNDENVTKIGRGAFAGNTRISKVIMKYVTDVSEYAFSDCTSLSDVELGTLQTIGSYAFYSIPLIYIPSLDSVEYIGDYAFAYTDIFSLNVRDGAIIGDGAFAECQHLESVTIGDGVTIGDYAFYLSISSENPRTGATNWTFGPVYVEGKRLFGYSLISPLNSLSIGEDAIIGDYAFSGASELTAITLGEGAVIGDYSFYNNASLKTVDLSKVKSIGDYAFAGDSTYVFADSNMSSPYIKDNMYVYTYHTPDIEAAILTSAESVGSSAFMNCKSLHTVELGSAISVIESYAFCATDSLKSINTENIESIGEYAFALSGLESIDISATLTVGQYAFANSLGLTSVTLNPEGCDVKDAAFYACTALMEVNNLSSVKEIGAVAFAYTAITDLDLSSAVSIGDFAFIKEKNTKVNVTLSNSLESLGENPFAYCVLLPFSSTVKETFNGTEYETITYTYDISDTISVIDGSLYARVTSGLELITFCDKGDANVIVADGTVRITSRAFAGSGVKRVTLPHSLNSIGHMAFYECENLTYVVFKSYEAPNLEEEFDTNYFYDFNNIPATGDYTFMYTNGEEITFSGLAIVPFYMWNFTDAPQTFFYGANFVDYIGKLDPIVMVRPSNGRYYDSFIYAQYFDTVIDGDVSADDTTILAIEAISRLPKTVSLSDEHLVIAAREAYNKIATTVQQSLVTNYKNLLTAESRIKALKSAQGGQTPDVEVPDIEEPVTDEESSSTGFIVVIIIESVALAVAIAAIAYMYFTAKKKSSPSDPTDGDTEEETETCSNEENAPTVDETVGETSETNENGEEASN